MNTKLNLEEYAPIGDFLLKSFKRDRTVMSKLYTHLTEEYVSEFENLISQVKSIDSIPQLTKSGKETTFSLYAYAEEVRGRLGFLRDYAKRANLSVDLVDKIRKALKYRNIEGGVKDLRDALPYYKEKSTALKEQGGMPDGHLATYDADIVQLENYNKKQNEILSKKKEVRSTNDAIFAQLDTYFGELAQCGKRVFKNTDPTRAEEYTISRLLTQVRVQKKGNTPPPTPQP